MDIGRLYDRGVALVERLLTIGREASPEEFFEAESTAHTRFALSDPFAFLLATCLDRGAPSKRIWSIPLQLRGILGHLDARRISQMPPREFVSKLALVPSQPRYADAFPLTVRALASLITNRFEGRAELLWKDRSAADVRRDLDEIYGVGPEIASMGVLLIERVFGVRFPDIDRPRMDIKGDVQTMRVLRRLGQAHIEAPEAAKVAARKLRPQFPGEIDGGLWLVGHRWCLASKPLCQECDLRDICPSMGSDETVPTRGRSCRS